MWSALESRSVNLILLIIPEKLNFFIDKIWWTGRTIGGLDVLVAQNDRIHSPNVRGNIEMGGGDTWPKSP